MSQAVKNPPAMQETWVQSLGGEIPWRREWLPTLVFLLGVSMDRGANFLDPGGGRWGWGNCPDPQGLALVAQTVKRLPTMRETRVRSLGQEDSLEKETATHFSIHAWKIPWTKEPGGL